jgi:hypothetical protein
VSPVGVWPCGIAARKSDIEDGRDLVVDWFPGLSAGLRMLLEQAIQLLPPPLRRRLMDSIQGSWVASLTSAIDGNWGCAAVK